MDGDNQSVTPDEIPWPVAGAKGPLFESSVQSPHADRSIAPGHADPLFVNLDKSCERSGNDSQLMYA